MNARTAVTIFAVVLSGCAAKPDPIPHYERTDLADSLATLRLRMAGLHTVRGEASITLASAKGRSVNLDAAYVLAPPARARLRAWKFGQAVFDLTIDGDKAWAYLPREEARPAAPGLRQSLGRWLGLLGSGDVFTEPAEINGDTITLTRPAENGLTLHCVVDRPTLTPRRYALVDDGGVERFVLTLADYHPVDGGQVWPSTIVATSEAGIVTVRTGDVEVNGELDDAAFKPPARAEALP